MVANWNNWADGGTSVPPGQVAAVVAAGQALDVVVDRVQLAGWRSPFETIHNLNTETAPKLNQLLGLIDTFITAQQVGQGTKP